MKKLGTIRHLPAGLCSSECLSQKTATSGAKTGDVIGEVPKMVQSEAGQMGTNKDETPLCASPDG